MTERPLFGIIIPVYNTEAYVQECIESVLKQSYRHFICVIVNDGSTDRSLEIIYTLLEKHNIKDEAQFAVLNKKNGGVSSARNYALEYLISLQQAPDYICFIDSDDVVEQDMLDRFKQIFGESDADYVVCAYDTFTDKLTSRYSNLKPKTNILSHNEIIEHYYAVKAYDIDKNEGNDMSINGITWGLWNKSFKFEYIKNHRFNENLKHGEDMALFAQISHKFRKGVFISDCLYNYRVRGDSLTHQIDLSRVVGDLDLLTDIIKNWNVGDYLKLCVSLVRIRVLYSAFYKAVLFGTKELSFTLFNECRRTYMSFKTSDDISTKNKRRYGRLKYGYTFARLYIKLRELNKKRRHGVK